MLHPARSGREYRTAVTIIANLRLRWVAGGTLVAALAAAALWLPARWAEPAGTPVVVWSVTDSDNMRDIIAEFSRRNPHTPVQYRELKTQDLNSEYLDQVRRGAVSADLLISSAMDLQIKLVNDGLAQEYRSTERDSLPDGTVWKDQAWGLTAEPVVFAYNRRLHPELAAVRSHQDLIALLERNPPGLQGRIVTYDPARSAVGYLFLSQDQQANRDTARLIAALGRNRAVLATSSAEMLDGLRSGQFALAYNMNGAYVLDAHRNDPDIIAVRPNDYTLIMSRIALIPLHAPHPRNARKFLDFMLSARGQDLLARQSMTPVRNDVKIAPDLVVDGDDARRIAVSPALLVNLDTLTRRGFLKRWHQAFPGAGTPGDTGQ